MQNFESVKSIIPLLKRVLWRLEEYVKNQQNVNNNKLVIDYIDFHESAELSMRQCFPKDYPLMCQDLSSFYFHVMERDPLFMIRLKDILFCQWTSTLSKVTMLQRIQGISQKQSDGMDVFDGKNEGNILLYVKQTLLHLRQIKQLTKHLFVLALYSYLCWTWMNDEPAQQLLQVVLKVLQSQNLCRNKFIPNYEIMKCIIKVTQMEKSLQKTIYFYQLYQTVAQKKTDPMIVEAKDHSFELHPKQKINFLQLLQQNRHQKQKMFEIQQNLILKHLWKRYKKVKSRFQKDLELVPLKYRRMVLTFDNEIIRNRLHIKSQSPKRISILRLIFQWISNRINITAWDMMSKRDFYNQLKPIPTLCLKDGKVKQNDHNLYSTIYHHCERMKTDETIELYTTIQLNCQQVKQELFSSGKSNDYIINQLIKQSALNRDTLISREAVVNPFSIHLKEYHRIQKQMEAIIKATSMKELQALHDKFDFDKIGIPKDCLRDRYEK